MASYQHIALLGKGFLGSAVLEQLLIQGFDVAVFTRSQSSPKDLPKGVHVAEVDYASLESLVDALRGKDAVVSTLNGDAIPGQKLVIDAAIKAGVKRFIPADFGSMTTDPEARKLPVHEPMVQIQDYLAEKARDGQIEYTIFSTGPFLDLVLAFPFLFDYPNKTAAMFDDGKHPFSTTTTSSIGKAIAGSFKKPEATKNRNVFVHDVVTTQAQLLELAKKHSPPDAQWTETEVDAAADLQKQLDDIAQNGMNPYNSMGLLKAAILSGKYGSHYKVVDNEILGLGLWSEEDLDDFIASKLQ